MRKSVLLVAMIFVFMLSGCGLRERVLAPPDEMEIPEGSLSAVCTVGEDVFTHIYQGDGIYQYYVNGDLQDEEELNNIQEQAFLNGESVENYLNISYSPGECVIEDYTD